MAEEIIDIAYNGERYRAAVMRDATRIKARPFPISAHKTKNKYISTPTTIHTYTNEILRSAHAYNMAPGSFGYCRGMS